MNAIDLKNLDISYGDTKVVHGVNLAIAEGESFALVGESGSGKSTILRAIAGLAPDWTGKSPCWGGRAAMGWTARWRGNARWCFRTLMGRCIRARRLTRH